jgi:soluble lytic murein transglycosylase
MVDWIEMIPFNETRGYVQRVLENLQIYRGQSGPSATAFSLASDLAR